MSGEPTQDVAVIIAARNAEATIGLAVASALAQHRTAEVVVVDDASTDMTADAARGADDGTHRLSLIRLEKQVGPSRARNLAIAASTARLIAVLDGDDVFLPERFDWLLQDDGWDFVADNIVMYRSADLSIDAAVEAARDKASPARPTLTLQGFVEGNISGSSQRRELGFLKPVMRRAFLDRAGLLYDESIRFAEDYDLYCRALIAGARFRIDLRVGYGALVHSASLSATHSTLDLASVADVDRRLLNEPNLDAASREALKRHLRQVMSKHSYRKLLDLRREEGLASSVLALLAAPKTIPGSLQQFATDKLRPLRRQQFDEPVVLMSPEAVLAA